MKKGLQPGLLQILVQQDLLATERTTVGGLCKPCQHHIHANNSMKELPTYIPSGLWDQGTIQVGPPPQVTAGSTTWSWGGAG